MRNFFLLFLVCIINHLIAQNKIPENYFRSPIDIKLSVSSNFGKIRPNHFHSGLDISTKLKTGIKIYAAASGYISRVNISPNGYGNAIYITHANGYTTVYAHLSVIEASVAKYVHQVQYQRHSFNLDLNFPPDKFPVKKGQVIGASGNTGRSFGAHLHFEIRNTNSEEILNPLRFGFNLPDNEAPKIRALYLYQFFANGITNEFLTRQKLKIEEGDTVKSFNQIGFGIEIRDFLMGKKGNFDPYQLKLIVDDSLLFHYQFNQFAFDETKYINSFIDYSELKKTGKKIIKCFVEPNNKLNIYKTNSNGLFDNCDGKIHSIRVLASDIRENSTQFLFFISSDSLKAMKIPQKSVTFAKRIDYAKIDEFSTDSFKIVFDENCLYDFLDFNYYVSQSMASTFSKYHFVHNPYIPLHNQVTIKIKPFKIPDSLKTKTIIVEKSGNGRLNSVGGNWNGEFVETKISNFGIYLVTIDTILPTILPVSFTKRKSKNLNYLYFNINDNLSGISEYNAFIDDKWILFEYDEKKNLISCNLRKEKISKGSHHLILWVRDNCNNLSIYESDFIN